MYSILYIVVGLFVGCVGAILGIGGGIFVVPLMSFVFGVDPQQAAGTSLFVVMINSFSGAVGYMRKKMVCVDAAWRFALATVPGALVGGYVSDLLSAEALSVVFAILFALLAVYMLLKSRSETGLSECVVTEKYNWKLGSALSMLVGFLSSILGIGGGIIHVPMMTYLLRFPIKVSVATSTAILFVSATSGVVSHWCFDHILWTPALCIGLGALVGAQLGVKVVGKLRSSILVKCIAILLLFVAAKFLYSSLCSV